MSRVMKILAILTPASGKNFSDLSPHLVAEERAVWADYETGFLREMYFQPDPVTVTLIVEAQGEAAVRERLASYPMVAAGLLDIRVIQLGPWLPLKALFRSDALN